MNDKIEPVDDQSSVLDRIQKRFEKNFQILKDLNQLVFEDQDLEVLKLYAFYCKLNNGIEKYEHLLEKYSKQFDAEYEENLDRKMDFDVKFALIKEKFDLVEDRFKDVKLNCTDVVSVGVSAISQTNTKCLEQKSVTSSLDSYSICPTSPSFISQPIKQFNYDRYKLIEKFSGNIMQFGHFWKQFKVLVEDCDLCDAEKYNLLNRCLDGEASRLLCCLILPDYSNAKKILFAHYTNRESIQQYIRTYLKLLKPVKNIKDTVALREIFFKINDINHIMSEQQFNQEFQCFVFTILSEKIPECFVSTFVEHCTDMKCGVSITAFVDHLHNCFNLNDFPLN